ncbi:hypothetical protein GUJ93_ZPchr0007g3448 [Zizania palustris]|uniref:Uncharacterized protein n=1 Tax=Zizania palustris TaxID=103762 RepID=A0A8J5T6H5_ZIZPA|nr:hypothetical protein GUJ93_ZPchr0007g3448 [Zizania palustris]
MERKGENSICNKSRNHRNQHRRKNTTEGKEANKRDISKDRCHAYGYCALHADKIFMFQGSFWGHFAGSIEQHFQKLQK